MRMRQLRADPRPSALPIARTVSLLEARPCSSWPQLRPMRLARLQPERWTKPGLGYLNQAMCSMG